MEFKKQLLIQLGIALGVLIVAIVTIQLIAGDLRKNADKINQQKAELALRTQATGSLADLKSDFEKAKPLIQALNNKLPPKDSLINLGQQLVTLASRHKMDFGFAFSGEQPQEEDVPGFTIFTLNGSATYANLLNFIKDLEKSSLFIKINSIDLSRLPESSEFKVVIGGQVFYQ